MLDDKTFPISNTMYGALNSAVSVPNMIIPFFGGHIMDSRGHFSILCFLVLMCIGHSIVAFGMQQHTFWMAILGRVIYGLGGGSVIVGVRAMVSYWFDSNEITFAVGVMVAFTSLAKVLAKSTVAPIAMYFGSYTYGLLYGLAVCFLSCAVAVVSVQYIHRLKQLKRKFKQQLGATTTSTLAQPSEAAMDPALPWLNAYLQAPGKRFRPAAIVASNHMPSLSSLREFPLMFWVLVIMHVVYANVFHLFLNISSSYLYQVHGYSVIESGIVTSLSHVLVLFAPVAGLIIDRTGGRVIVVVASAALGVVTYGLLLFTSTSPVVALLLVSICLCATPTVLMACVPLTIPKSRFGLAFGIAEVFDAVGTFSGNLVVGYIRDATGSYTPVIHLFFTLAWILLGMCIVLAVLDSRHGNILSGKKQENHANVTVANDDDVVVDIRHGMYEATSSDDDEAGRPASKDSK
ncbi:hypothetical protein, variant [Aphanomyces invadans]|nr:hypothetical protein, variant [Aphanomyces invadans]ETW10283.1 hypothetical protein, variant [Aphanomyces invadans]|eukprot:XP_008861694.1 hypothetical protein, variant [Aphanomyces invadans]